MKKLSKCHDCGVEPGYTHKPGCDVERCSVCGGQKIGCECEGHDPCFARWTGIWPGYAETRELGLFTKFTNHGWEDCSAYAIDATPDLNRFYAMGYAKIFFVKPTIENGKDITDGK